MNGVTTVSGSHHRYASNIGIPGTVYLIVNAIRIAEYVKGLTTILSRLRSVLLGAQRAFELPFQPVYECIAAQWATGAYMPMQIGRECVTQLIKQVIRPVTDQIEQRFFSFPEDHLN